MKCDIDWIYPLTSHLPRISVVIFEKIFRNNRGNVTSQIEMSLNNWRCKQIVPHIFEPNIFLTFGHFHQNIILHFPSYWKEVLYFVRPGMCWQERVVRWLLAEVCLLSYIVGTWKTCTRCKVLTNNVDIGFRDTGILLCFLSHFQYSHL